MEEEKIYQIPLQYKIENIVTNGIGFRNSLKNFSIRPSEVDTLLGLRKYLSAMESNVSLKKRNFKKYFEASRYLDCLYDMAQWLSYHKKFDLNTPIGIDNALKDRAEGISNFFNNAIIGAA